MKANLAELTGRSEWASKHPETIAKMYGMLKTDMETRLRDVRNHRMHLGPAAAPV